MSFNFDEREFKEDYQFNFGPHNDVIFKELSRIVGAHCKKYYEQGYEEGLNDKVEYICDPRTKLTIEEFKALFEKQMDKLK